MKVRIAGDTLSGRAIDLRDAGLDPATVAAAIRGDSGAIVTDRSVSIDDSTATDCAIPDDLSVSIECQRPGPAHDHIGAIRAGMDLRLRSALAAAARSRGHAAPQADELAAVRDRLDSLDAPEIDLQRARRRVADASDTEAELRERVATLQGRVQALRETSDEGGGDRTQNTTVEDAEAELAEATRRLSEVETERIAAEQALARARERAKANRERRRKRLRLQDRADNLRRTAREHLAETVHEVFADARDSLPADADDPTLGGSVGDALAVARVAELSAPVVLARDADPFGSAEAAARWLDGPVLRL